MSLADRIKARSENAGNGPKAKPAQPPIEIHKDEVEALNKELDSELEDNLELEVSKEESLTPEQIVKRTEDSYEDEIKKLREENAKRRKKEQEAKEKALAMADEVFKTEREEYESQLAEMKKQLEEAKALKKEENKVEAEIKKAETSAESEQLLKELKELREANQKIQAQIQAQREAEEQEKSLRKQAAENRFKSMLTEIPEEFKDYASAMFKGYSDPSEGLIALTKAKAQGLFGKRTIEVVSRVPRESNNNENKVLTGREKREQRVSALKTRRQGLTPGQKL
jgi:DNA repair exonuclease SbcCD ATPase subunit